MESILETLNVTIPSGRTLRVRDAGGLMLHVVEGTAWITEHGDPNDYTLAGGDVRLVASDGLMLVHAFEPTQLRIAAPRGLSRATVELGAGYNEFAMAVWRRCVADVGLRFLTTLRNRTGMTLPGRGVREQNRAHEAGDPVLQKR